MSHISTNPQHALPPLHLLHRRSTDDDPNCGLPLKMVQARAQSLSDQDIFILAARLVSFDYVIVVGCK